MQVAVAHLAVEILVVEHGAAGVVQLGDQMPVGGAPDSCSRRSSAPRLAGSVKVPVTDALVPPIATSACTGKGCLASCKASIPPTLPSPLVASPLNLPSTFQPNT
ncbi:hypothetical protein G6F65_021891 [Rhizopus arrhizus]|nr:hypothetical protein G6F65_021891 [Rhizopus arrhizus]